MIRQGSPVSAVVACYAGSGAAVSSAQAPHPPPSPAPFPSHSPARTTGAESAGRESAAPARTQSAKQARTLRPDRRGRPRPRRRRPPSRSRRRRSRSRTCGPPVLPSPSQLQSMIASIFARVPVIRLACTPSHAMWASCAVHLVVVLADLGDGGTAADHRHDPLVAVDGTASAPCPRSRRGCCRRPTCRSGARPSRAAAAALRPRPRCWRCRPTT